MEIEKIKKLLSAEQIKEITRLGKGINNAYGGLAPGRTDFEEGIIKSAQNHSNMILGLSKSTGSVKDFINGKFTLVESKTRTCPASFLYQYYLDWCSDTDTEVLTNHDFYKEIRKFKDVRTGISTGNRLFVYGLSFKDNKDAWVSWMDGKKNEELTNSIDFKNVTLFLETNYIITDHKFKYGEAVNLYDTYCEWIDSDKVMHINKFYKLVNMTGLAVVRRSCRVITKLFAYGIQDKPIDEDENDEWEL